MSHNGSAESTSPTDEALNPFHARLNTILNEERKRSSTFTANTKDVMFLWCSSPGHIDHESWVQPYLLVHWKHGGGSDPQAVKVRYGPLDDRQELEISQTPDNYWKTVRQWLRERYGEERSRQAQLEEHWKQTGSSFPFMNLPVELQRSILGFAIGTRIWPHNRTDCCKEREKETQCISLADLSAGGSKSRDKLPTLLDADSWRAHITGTARVDRDCEYHLWPEVIAIHAPSRTIQDWEPNHEETHPGIGMTRHDDSWAITLLSINKHIRKIAEDLIWGSSTKHFNSMHILINAMPWLLAMESYHALNHVSLSLLNREYLGLVGFEGKPGVGFAPLRYDLGKLEHLTDLPSLSRLHLQFQVTRGLMNANGYATIDPWSLVRRRARPITSCQKVFVDWFFTLAYDRLRNVPKVTFSGHVKNSVRSKWEKIFGEPRQSPRHDMSSEIAKIRSTPVKKLPPRCHCSKPCTWWDGPERRPGRRSTYQEWSDED
ncbi:uncharacterized protein K460DRAFT_363310 [Cucurbitaria berberidis CBS 394.84]|uniref:Uncharacterized protein n=1 Tax=Cucurbitaria berberidis CBS 394.84 TaxID=1168544 RepID=A0A9P4GJ72_9PLEO|nr:uncharacterized protein K460DRAFT_363310 [Cucurbitaria berberidis CBS 394.84]KAF1847203.1 hypothetical protein K460DRAFT_363310 [Cucurbitaria berberidis CBS 394.84]